MFKKIKEGIVNLIIWFPIIWKDRHWDHAFLYEIIQFKLKKMADYQKKHGMCVDSNKYAKQMEMCVNLLARITSNKYLNMTMKEHNKKWGERKTVFTPCKDHTNLLKLDFIVEKVRTEEEKTQERKELKKCHERANYLKNQDLDMLFQTMRKYIEGWWD
jgi:hypothetical protein